MAFRPRPNPTGLAKVLLVSLLAAGLATAGGQQTVRLLRVQFSSLGQDSLREAMPDGGTARQPLLRTRPDRTDFVVVGSSQSLDLLPRQRAPELARGQLVVATLDARGEEIARIYLNDPRIVRHETADPTGRLTGEPVTFFRAQGEFTLALPDRAGLRAVRIYQPRWTGDAFVLELLAELDLR